MNEKFIIKMLEKKKILGYATDVLQDEFKKKFEIKNIIWKNRNKLNILITPHIGGSTADAWFSTQKRVIDKFLKECKKKNYMKKKILVCGADGYLGWPTAMYLSEKGYQVTAIDNFSKRKIENENNIKPLNPIETMQIELIRGRKFQKN